jgi:hypothetical protein
VVGAGGSAAVDGGQLGQPVAFQAVQQPPQLQDLVGQGDVGQAVQIQAGQPVDGRGQRGQLIRWSDRLPA